MKLIIPKDELSKELIRTPSNTSTNVQGQGFVPQEFPGSGNLVNQSPQTLTPTQTNSQGEPQFQRAPLNIPSMQPSIKGNIHPGGPISPMNMGGPGMMGGPFPQGGPFPGGQVNVPGGMGGMNFGMNMPQGNMMQPNNMMQNPGMGPGPNMGGPGMPGNMPGFGGNMMGQGVPNMQQFPGMMHGGMGPNQNKMQGGFMGGPMNMQQFPDQGMMMKGQQGQGQPQKISSELRSDLIAMINRSKGGPNQGHPQGFGQNEQMHMMQGKSSVGQQMEIDQMGNKNG